MAKFVLNLLYVAFLLFSCRHKGEVKEKGVSFPITFGSQADYPDKRINIEEIADIQYIPLETSQRCLLQELENTRYWQDDSLIFFNHANSVFCFDSQGNFRNCIGKTGHGPGEYNRLSFFCLNRWKKEVYVYDGHSRIFIYDYGGTFKRWVEVNGFLSDMACISPDVLLTVKDVKPFANHKIAAVSLFEEINVTDGSCKREYGHSVSEGSPSGKVKNIYVGSNWRILKSGNDYVLNDCFRDTLYALTPEKILVPVYIQRPALSVVNRYVKIETERFTLLEIDAFNFSGMDRLAESVRKQDLWINKESGEIFSPRFLWNREEIRLLTLNGDPVQGLIVIQPIKLLEKLRQGKLDGELKEIASGLTEDSNPVLMVVKFKDQSLE